MEEGEEINEMLSIKIDEIQKQVKSGKINILNYELVSIFTELQKTINVNYLDKNSKTYMKACNLLEKKFEELRKLLGSLDNEKKFIEYLKLDPDDGEINQLFDMCWRTTFNLDPLSLEFLEASRKKLGKLEKKSYNIEHLKMSRKSGEYFILSVPEQGFSDHLLEFYDSTIEKLPCFFDEIFDGEHDQIKIYEKFVYILHLLQLGKIKFQKETNTLYI